MKTNSIPTDDRPESILARAEAVAKDFNPPMPSLKAMTRKQMAETLQSIWTHLDEAGVQRRNESSPEVELSIYGRVYIAIHRGGWK